MTRVEIVRTMERYGLHIVEQSKAGIGYEQYTTACQLYTKVISWRWAAVLAKVMQQQLNDEAKATNQW